MTSDITTLSAGKWTIVGTSIGGTHTTITVRELGVCFDIGVLTTESVSSNLVLISHGHVDHCQSFFKHNRCREMRKMTPKAVYIVPPAMHRPIVDAATAQFNMEKGFGGDVAMPDNYVNIITTDDAYSFTHCKNSRFDIHSYPMTHRIPARGYALVSNVSKLMDKYIGKPGKEIKALREAGEELFYQKRSVEIAYTGDTTIEGVLRQSDFLNAEVLLMECTILDDQLSRKDTAKRGHIHIQDIVEHWSEFNNKHIILFHISPRYTGSLVHTLITDALASLPIEFKNKIQVLWPH